MLNIGTFINLFWKPLFFWINISLKFQLSIKSSFLTMQLWLPTTLRIWRVDHNLLYLQNVLLLLWFYFVCLLAKPQISGIWRSSLAAQEDIIIFLVKSTTSGICNSSLLWYFSIKIRFFDQIYWIYWILPSRANIFELTLNQPTSSFFENSISASTLEFFLQQN